MTVVLWGVGADTGNVRSTRSERRAFTRFVESSVSDHDLTDGGAYKPAVVATSVEEDTLEATEREDALVE